MLPHTLVLIATLTPQGVPQVPDGTGMILPGIQVWRGASTSAPSGPAVDGLSVAITAVPTTVHHGQPIKFAVEMRNVSQSTLYYWAVHFSSIHFTVVNTATGAILPERRPRVLESGEYRNNGNPLEPRTSAYKEMTLSDLFELVPGTYDISVAFSVDGTGQLQKPVQLQSNTITVRVLP